MGLTADLANAVTQIMTQLGDIPRDATYHSVTVGSYNAATNSVSTTEETVSCKALMYRAKEKTSDNARSVENVTKVLIAAQALGNIVPKESDYIMIAGQKWEISMISMIPSNPAYIFTVRLP